MINMQQPDPAGLFDKYQGQRRNPPSSTSVVAQISNRPAPPSSLPSVPPPTATPQQQQVSVENQPVNPFVALYESGVMDQAVQQAQPQNIQLPQENPFKALYESGAMTQSVLEAEDNQYEKDMETWRNQRKNIPAGNEYRSFLSSPTTGMNREPQAPARDIEQIGQDWNLGAKVLRGQELGNILHSIESAQMTPEQEAIVTRHIEPELSTDLKKQLHISRLTRDKFLEMQQQAQQEEQQASEFAKESLYMSPGQIARDPRFGSQSQRTNVLGRTLAKGATANYAFAPNKDRLNSENPEEQAEERAKRLFYQKQEAEYPGTAITGNMIGALLPIGATGMALRGARVAGATRALAAGPPTAKTAGVITTKGAPTTTAGILAESAAIGLPYDILSRPEGSEEMNLKENLFARGQNIGFGLAVGLGFDLGLMGMGKAWRKLKQMPGDVVNKAEVKRRGKLLDDLAEKNNYENADDMLDDLFLTTIRDESGERVRMQTEILDVLPEFKELSDRVQKTQTSPETPQTPSLLGRETPARTEEPAPTTERFATGEAEATVQGRAESTVKETAAEISPGRETAGKETIVRQTEVPTEHKVTGSEIIEAPIDELTLSADVPQFKSGANQQGVVEALGGTFDRTGVGPIQVWVRNDGSKEVISGRHRLDLARRSGEKTIPAQYHYESQGFGRDQAATLDAMLNIREGQGKVRDYVDFIKGTGLTEAEANAQGILARATGRRAYTIANQGSDALITAHRANQLTDEAATRIASAAPNNEALQAVGIKAIQDGKTITVAENMVKAVRTMTDESAMRPGGDMFGFDDSALREAEALARKAAAKQADIQKTLSAVQGAAKNPERAAKEGVDVKDPEAVKRRIDELKQEKQDWQNWHTNPELTAQLRGEKVTPQPKASEQPKPPDQQEGFDLTSQTEAELSARAKSQQQAEVVDLKQQQDLEAKAKADLESKEFELGIQGSGQDVSARQSDLLGLGGRTQPNKQSSVKSEPTAGAKVPEIKSEAPKKATETHSNREVKDHSIKKAELEKMKTAVGAINWIEANAKEPVFQEIAKKIKNLMTEDIEIVIGKPGKNRKTHGVFKYDLDSDKNLINQKVVINESGANESTLTHELIHAATISTIYNPKTKVQKKAVKDLHQLISDINDAVYESGANNILEKSYLSYKEARDIAHGARSIEELVTHSLTDPNFQRALKKLKSKNVHDDESYFHKFTKIMKELLGFSENNNFLERAINISSEIIESAKKTEVSAKQTINEKTGQLEFNGKQLTKARKSDLEQNIKQGIADGDLPGKFKDYKIDVPEGKKRWVAEYQPSTKRVKPENLTKSFEELNTNEYYSFLESLTEAEQKALRKQLNLADNTSLEKLVNTIEGKPIKEKNAILKPAYDNRLKRNEAPNTILALEQLDTVSSKDLDQIAQLMSMPKKKKGETVRGRENRLRDVYKIFKDLSNESMKSLQQKSKAELVELAKSINKFKSRYNKTDLAGYITDWRKMVLERLDKQQKLQDLYKSVSSKIKNNEPVSRSDAEKLLGKHSGGIYTDNDIAVARILNQDKVLPPSQRSPEHHLLYNLAEKLNDSTKSVDLANDLLKHPSVKELLPKINDVVNRDVLSVTVDLTPVGKTLKVPDIYVNDFTSEFAGAIADSLLEAAHKANIKIPAYKPPKAPKVNNPKQKLSDIKQNFQKLRDQGHPVVGKYIDLIDDMQKAFDSNKPFTIDYRERYGHHRPSQVIDGYNHQSFNEYVKHLDEIAEAANRGVQRRLDTDRGNIPTDIILSGRNGNTPFLLEKIANREIKKKIADGTLKGTVNDWQAVKFEGGYGIKRVQPEAKPKVKPTEHNLQTIDDYQKVIRENGKDSLTTAQRAEYERLNAEAQQQATAAAEPKAKPIKGLETEQALEIEPITEGTHTKTGKTIFNVKVNTKLGKQKFQEAAQQARSMGGNYYKGQFWLKTKDDARQFVDWLNGQIH